MSSDHIPFLALSAAGGHGGPDSTAWYIHQIEQPLALQSRHARPAVWTGGPPSPQLAGVFEDLCEGLVVEVPPLPEPGPSARSPQRSADLTVEQRCDILWDVQCDYQLDAVAAKAMVSRCVVEEVVADMTGTLTTVGMARQSVEVLRARCQALSAWAVWARASRQPKYDGLRQLVERLEKQGEWGGLRRLWSDFLVCRNQDAISVENGRPAARLIGFLQEAGVPTTSMAIASVASAPSLHSEVHMLGISHRPAEPRGGRANHRLFLTAPGVCARSASGATVSMRGLHWIILVLGSALLARGEI